MLFVVTTHPWLMKDHFAKMLLKSENNIILDKLNVKSLDDISFVETKFGGETNITFNSDTDFFMEMGCGFDFLKFNNNKRTSKDVRTKSFTYAIHYSSNELGLYEHGTLCSRKNPEHYHGSLFF